MSASDRISWLMQSRDIPSVAEAARRYGIGYELMKKLVSGERQLTQKVAERIASHHRISPTWLLLGEGAPTGKASVPLIGAIGAGQEMILFGEGDDRAEFVEATIGGAESSAFVVRGDSMYPVARDGDLVFFGPPRRDAAALIGAECAAVLDDGRRLFKMLARGARPGSFDLMSYNAEPIRDVIVHSAAPFLGLRRVKSPARRVAAAPSPSVA